MEPETYIDASTNWVDGKELVRWVKSQLGEIPNGYHKKYGISRWQRGGAVHYFTVDKFLMELGLHICDLPVEFYCSYRDVRPRKYRKHAKRTR